MKDFGGKSGSIDYGAPSKKKDLRDLGSSGRQGASSKTKGIGTTDQGDTAGYSGTVKDTSFRQVADASGWDH